MISVIHADVSVRDKVTVIRDKNLLYSNQLLIYKKKLDGKNTFTWLRKNT